MKALSIGFFSTVIVAAQQAKNAIERASLREVYMFIDDNFAPLAISLSTILAAELIVVAILAR